MKSYRDDPRWITVRYAGTCKMCGKAIPAGAQAYYYPRGKTLLCADDKCGGHAAREFAAAAMDEAMYCGQTW
jgi:hypothetical protein